MMKEYSMPPQSITKLAIGMISKSAMATTFKTAGFRRQANHLHRRSADLFHGVHFQASQFGVGDYGSFTVNVIIAWESYYQNFLGQCFPSNPGTANYQFSERIGGLMPGNQSDQWWEVDPTTDLETICQEVVSVLINCAVPYLDQLPDRESVLKDLRNGGPALGLHPLAVPGTHAAVAHDLGYLSEAQDCLTNAIRESRDAEDISQFRRIAKRLNLHVG